MSSSIWSEAVYVFALRTSFKDLLPLSKSPWFVSSSLGSYSPLDLELW
uniref:Uncharacterized protein n=1 Tax=Brassica oleracea TaxID=3712 RepID=A0A3P6AN22_BRAOL|nr:unnamed protein product [Brassica oleracea]